jgi:putative N6-adenine-specific DNA methylase
MSDPEFEIYLVVPPGLEEALAAEAAEHGFADPQIGTGGVTVRGDRQAVMRANLVLRGASRVLVRIGSFRALHLAQLDKRARKFPWRDFLRPDLPVRVEASCKASRIYHDRAAAQRIATAIGEELGAPVDAEAAIRVKARIEKDVVTISLDTSGEPLHKRGFKTAMAKAPMRETLAALFLRQCGYDGRESLVDPMCGSGTFVIEAAEVALGLAPGRGRDFAFEHFAGHDADAWTAMKAAIAPTSGEPPRLFGFDRDPGAIRMSQENAGRAGVTAIAAFERQAINDLAPPDAPPGLVIVNPPYGARIGDKARLKALYATLGAVLRSRFSGWRVGLVTSEAGLAKASRLPFAPPGPPIDHGGLKIRLFQTPVLR